MTARIVRRRLTRGVAASALGLSALFVATAHADGLPGPEFGSTKITSAITDQQGEPDVDDYAAPVVQGEKLVVTVVAGKGTNLVPDLALVAPDGSVIDAATIGVKYDKKGTKAQIKSFLVPSTGVWTVRVLSKLGSQGAYTITTKVVPIKPLKLKNQTIDAAGQATLEHAFGGFDDAQLTFSILWKKGKGPVRVDALLDPADAEVANPAGGLAKEAVVAKGTTKLELKKMPLSAGVGSYVLRTAIDAGTATYSLTLSVAPSSRRSTGSKPVALSAIEPFLAARTAPLVGIRGQRVQVTGANFLDGAVVRFGDLVAANVVISGDRTSITADVPDGVDGSLVAVSVQNPDGQAARREGYFLYPLPPEITDVTTATNVSIRGGSTGGVQVRKIVGANFSPPVRVRFGAAEASVDAVSDDFTTITVSTVAAPAGDVTVTVFDAFNRTATSPFTYLHKAPPAFATTPFDPPFGAVAGGTTITLQGTGLDAADALTIQGAAVPVTFVSDTALTFTSPARAVGTYTARLVDRFGTASTTVLFPTAAPPTVTGVVATAGLYAGPDEVPLSGGTTLRVTGTGIRTTNTVTLDGASIDATFVSSTSFDITVPAGSQLGGVDLVVTDAAGQSGSLADAVHYAGFVDATSSRSPGSSDADDLGARVGAIGDLDGDSRVDDLVLGSLDDGYAPGSRAELTRLFFGDGSTLSDVTYPRFPYAYTDNYRSDRWSAGAIAIGDIDGGGPEIVTTGPVTYTYYGPYGSYPTEFNDIRVFSNDGSGNFSVHSYTPSYIGAYAVIYDQYFRYNYTLWQSQTLKQGYGATNAVALGDLDGDTDLDIVSGTSRYRAGYLLMPMTYVSVTPGYYSTYRYAGYAARYGSPTLYYSSALQILINDVSNYNGFRNRSFPRLPLAGVVGKESTDPCFPATDVKLGDVDGDTSLDIVLTWPDPLTTTPIGLSSAAGGGSTDSARVCSAVLLNDGNGFFTDATSTWLPSPSGDEYWQGDRIALVDLDGDTDLDLVIAHNTSINAYTGSPTFDSHALRVLRNDGSSFTDVTTTVLPSVPLEGTADDNLRGVALLVTDVNKDGIVDIVVGTKEALLDSEGNPGRRTRLLLGRSGLSFILGNDFMPAAADETGECEDLAIGDIAGDSALELVLISESVPETSASGERLRVFDWKR